MLKVQGRLRLRPLPQQAQGFPPPSFGPAVKRFHGLFAQDLSRQGDPGLCTPLFAVEVPEATA